MQDGNCCLLLFHTWSAEGEDSNLVGLCNKTSSRKQDDCDI